MVLDSFSLFIRIQNKYKCLYLWFSTISGEVLSSVVFGAFPFQCLKLRCCVCIKWLVISLILKNAYIYEHKILNLEIFVAGNECCERLAYYGMSTNLVNYLIDRFNMGNATAANTVTNWSGTCYIMPLLGAFFADAYLGRYWTIASFSSIYVIVSSFKMTPFLFVEALARLE